MKSFAPTPILARPRTDRQPAFPRLLRERRDRAYDFLLLLSLVIGSASHLPAQVGNQNPSGASGAFNGQVNTGCSYDPYTGNATRTLTDIVVAGAVGEYPLALVRTANSRAPSTTEVFGWAGGWNHSYNWILEDSPTSNAQNFQPPIYTVDFPDGRVETFKDVTWDSYHRVRRGPDGSAGVRERFVPLNTNTMFAYLILSDGGKVEFTASQHVANGHYYYKYHATAIYDPYGLKTQLVSSTTPNGIRRRLDWVIEPAGRWLHFLYTGTNNAKIDHVDASDGRTVNYYYIYCNGCRLDRVRYYNNAQWDARYQYCNSNVGQGLPPLLWTADDPMYPGPMKRIAYDYKPLTPTNPDGTTPAYGQTLRERYWDGTAGHETSGAVVSTLTVGEAPNHTWIRTETRGDNATRTFVYDGAGHVTWASDFLGHQSTMAYDAKKYLNSFIDFNRNETNYTNNPITGNVTQIKYPLTQGDTPNQSTRPTVNYTYTNDTNAYYLHTIQAENTFTTTITRDGNNRITQITYPDGGYESFTDYDAFNQARSHRMKTGGTETFTFDSNNGRKLTYRNPDNPSGNPTIQYFYDALGRVNGVYDALNHPTNFDYNDRGQLTKTTLTADPVDGQRHWIANAYNPDGTLQSTTDQLSHVTSYAYDDYRRLTSVTPPDRGDGTGTHPTSYVYYDWIGRDYYTDTNAQPSWVVLSSGKLLRTIYDANWRKSSVTMGYASGDDTTSSYLYDGMGNVTWLTNQRSLNTAFYYDERNRPSEIHDVYGNISSFQYDTAGRRSKITRPNGQTITYNTFDAMNRVTQQTATQVPEPPAVTKYAYYAPGEGPVGLLKTMTDPHNTTEVYKYTYDLMGRKLSLTYPLDSLNPPARRAESFQYDAAGSLWKFTNRNGKTQTLAYDALNRLSYFTWNDGLTPRVDFGYDTASRLTTINNSNATISRAYWNDNSLGAETETPAGGSAKTAMYFYNDDGNLDQFYMPGYSFQYQYTGRNQLSFIRDFSTGAAIAHYIYDENGYTGDLTTRHLANGIGTSTKYQYDLLDRVTHIAHSLAPRDTRTLDYDYDSVGNRKWIKRDGGTGDVFGYDFADQVTAVKLNVANPSSTPVGTQTISYDANGNLTTFQPYDPAYTYTTNYLNQYTQRNAANAVYDKNGNMTQGFDGSGYTYDAQNRLVTAPGMSFKYDGLNRQVSRTANGVTTYSVWDGWNLIQDYHMSVNNVVEDASYLYGPTGLVKDLRNNRYYYQDASGSTSHLASSSGTLLEWYRYDLQGAPFFYDANNNQRNPNQSSYGVRHLFTGQQWYKEISLYDLRNRFYSPDIGRFLQADPVGFEGDGNNLYRYCGNNSVTSSDPMGLDAVPHGGYYTYVAYWPWNRLVGSHIVNGREWLQCAGAARFLGGGYVNNVYFNMPITRYWYQGAMLSTATAPGTVVATGWVGGRYPSAPPSAYSDPNSPLYGQTINHTLVLGYWDEDNNAHLFSQNPDGPIQEKVVNEDDAWRYNEVYVGKSHGPYEGTPSTRSIAEGNGASGNKGINRRVPSIIGGVFYPFGFGNRSPSLNFGEGRAATMLGAFSWSMNDAFLTGVLNWGDVGRDMFGSIGAMEPGIGPGSCFVVGTPVLMADGSEKPIESIQVGEAVLAWNEETKTTFSTKVVSALHHEEKMQTLFDVELEDGRRLTVNNDHPMYVVEDGTFTFSDEFAARFAKGESITFLDKKNQPIKVASLQMRRQVCKTYNLHVEGQGKNGHTYYANDILVHNFGAGYRDK
jgi:RHS repeat-associated protein